MKIRQGFVSNSSSSSFVLYGYCFDNKDYTTEEILKEIGYSYDKETEEWYDMFDELLFSGFYISDNSETGAPRGKIILGKILGEIEDSGYFENIGVINNLSDIKDEINEKFKSFLEKVNLNDSEPVLILGNRMS